jgi:hypothetical protein
MKDLLFAFAVFLSLLFAALSRAEIIGILRHHPRLLRFFFFFFFISS